MTEGEHGLLRAATARGAAAAAVDDRAWLTALLDIEAALARASATVGLITAPHADAIAAACRPDRVDTADDPSRVLLHRGLRDVADHVAAVSEGADGFRQLLERLLTVNASLIGQRQNEEMRRLSEVSLAQGEQAKTISAWAAIIFAPSLIGGVYGMNFEDMPELHWAFGYPFALSLMILVALLLFLVFRRRGWL